MTQTKEKRPVLLGNRPSFLQDDASQENLNSVLELLQDRWIFKR